MHIASVAYLIMLLLDKALRVHFQLTIMFLRTTVWRGITAMSISVVL